MRGAILFKKLWKETDTYLIKRGLQGDGAAWQVLVDRYSKLVYHIANQAGLKSHDCDEVFQEVFLALYKKLESLENEESLSYWITTVAKRLTWKQVHRTLGGKNEEIPEEFDFESPDQIPEEVLTEKILQHHVRQSLAQMDQKCRTLLIELFYNSDESNYEALAQKLGIARGSVGPTRNRCLAKFKKKFSETGDGEAMEALFRESL